MCSHMQQPSVIPLSAFYMEGLYITLRCKWGPRSWLVNFDGPYQSDRPPHVECCVSEDQWRSHMSYPLTNLRRVGRSYQWAVIGLRRHDGSAAHFTVYYASGVEEELFGQGLSE